MSVLKFSETNHCRSGSHCSQCRDLEAGRSFRESIVEKYPMKGVDFECPFGGEWGKPELAKPPSFRPAPQPKVDRGPTTPELAANYAKSTARWLRAGKPVVPEDEFHRRLDICMACEHVRLNTDGTMRKCSLCGCRRKKLERATDECPDSPPRWSRFPEEDIDRSGTK